MGKNRTLGTLWVVSLLLMACSPSAVEQVADMATSNVQPTSPPFGPTVKPEAASGALPVLSMGLTRGCERRDPGERGPQVGEPAIEFALMDVDGNPYVLSELLREKPVLLVFGSFT